ncbi:PAS domain-containing protein [Chitinivorax sp. B]|uniref:PAS domain-containing protein n=1 Tax=Chitinivorax sp. B TaxID=2502235 RepID=UPI0010F98DB0|nr:PAS domain-containing protein [Chitinivorax sp. B]
MMTVAALLDDVDILIFATDLDGRILFLNQTAARTLGIAQTSGAELICAELMPAWSHILLMKTAIPHANTERIWRGELALLSSNGGEIPVRLQLLAHQPSPDSPIIHLFYAQNLTGERRREHALTRAKHDAENSNHVRGQFLSNIASQLRNPIDLLHDDLTQLCQADELDVAHRVLLQQSLNQIRKIQRFIDDVLAYIDLEKI